MAAGGGVWSHGEGWREAKGVGDWREAREESRIALIHTIVR